MMKGIAMILMFSGCVGYAFAWMREFRWKMEELVYIKHILSSLRMEMEKGRRTFGECCLEISTTLKKPYCNIFKNMYEELELRREFPLHVLWERAVEEIIDYVKLKELTVIKRCSLFGTGAYVEIPMEAVSGVTEELDRIWQDMFLEAKRKTKLSFCLGISAGCLLCLLFL